MRQRLDASLRDEDSTALRAAGALLPEAAVAALALETGGR